MGYLMAVNKRPTDEQVKEFWEWCGWYIKASPTGTPYWYHPLLGKDRWSGQFPIPIDLNNLFKYAVPKLTKDYTHLDILFEYGTHGNTTVICVISFSNYVTRQIQTIARIEDKDPALALFWAIWKVIHEP